MIFFGFALPHLLFYLGIGCLAAGAFRRVTREEFIPSLSLFVLAGIFLSGFLTMSWNLFFPAGDLFRWALVALAFIGLGRPRLRNRAHRALFLWEVISLLVLFLAFSYFGAARGMPGDSGFYHLPGILWTIQEPMPLGIAHLNHALGLNSLVYGIGAAAALPFLSWKASLVFNAWIASAFFTFLGLWLRQRHGEAKAAVLFGLGLLLAFAFLATYLKTNLSTPSMELSVTLLPLLAFTFCLAAAQDERRRGSWIALAHLFSFFAVMTRLSVIPFLFLPFLTYLSLNRRRFDFKYAGRLVILSLLLGFPWLIRGLLASGCFLYPLASSCFPLPWNAAQIAHELTVGVASWYRLQRYATPEVLASYSWLSEWARVVLSYGVVKLTITLLVVALPFIFFRRSKQILNSALVFAAFLAISLAFWFHFVPEVRFGYATILAIGLFPATLAASIWIPEKYYEYSRWMLSIFIALFFYRAVAHMRSPQSPPDFSLWPTVSDEELAPVTTSPEGIQVRVAMQDNCWAKSLLCAKEVRPGLEITIWRGRFRFRSGH